MNDYVILFCQTIITLVFSFLFGLGLIKYYFNKNDNCNDNHKVQVNYREPSNYPAFNQNESPHSVSDAPQSNDYPESGYINKREPSNYPAFNQNESRHSVSGATQSDNNQESGDIHKRTPSSYPTFNKNESRHSVSGASQSDNNQESGHIHKRQSSYPAFNKNESRFSFSGSPYSNGEPPFVEDQLPSFPSGSALYYF
ncbi:hypothetical protein DICPUDRAFT_151686 [Dictyostelium purpureum]|uniref:Uncharacterized protein n=1 Tax=Dictyostelium purpureum TaxID=5786 RepID=F0ZJI0_DICPU|nr:uncharacterized protein DICPUDRAFT_151686 [Dictyostelium purpureum]EGC35924.1 hypothetical protein DICPUDRAFT_151686 [Dictyostelium purpureum]|eukprot:XP_003287578.1 hypothetical protein DICPUDRAFT_151686 [Dictyostelium purpureum]